MRLLFSIANEISRCSAVEATELPYYEYFISISTLISRRRQLFWIAFFPKRTLNELEKSVPK